MPLTTENTTFTRDVFGRYVCNTFEEAIASTDASRQGRPFDVIVVGAGSFGGVLAHRLFQLDRRARRHRILVLDTGPFLLPEHVQNLPVLGNAMGEVMFRPWTSPAALNLAFPGLALCLGGRSLFWGGWSPQLTDSELQGWPPALVKDLKEAYFPDAQRQIGTDTPNDFIFGPLYESLRDRLWARIGEVEYRFQIDAKEALDAPLAIVSSAQRAGIYPINKFSSAPLLIDAARRAWVESNGDDRQKRLMIVPGCAVKTLALTGDTVTAVRTSLGDLRVPPGGAVVIALGTIESARLPLASSFPDPDNLIGGNLMAHLRSNFTMRFPRTDLAIPADRLYAAALFVKGKSPRGHFHLQITASAASSNVTDSEAELFKKIPDIDTLDRFDLDDAFIVITIRGIGEMLSEHVGGSRNNIALTGAAEKQLLDPPLASVTLSTNQQERDLWADLDAATDQVANILAGDRPYEVMFGGWQSVRPGQPGQGPREVFPHDRRRDNLGSTHHEAGTLWMGDSPAHSVTDTWGRFHRVTNAWVAGPALFPTVGSPNPMLTGVALARRTAERIFERPFAAPVGQPMQLFNGVDLQGWTQAGPGRFRVENGMLITEGGMGLLWYSGCQFRNFELRVDWMVHQTSDNSGVFVRFPEPVVAGQAGGDPWVAVHEGYEIQIDDEGAPDGAEIHKTGGIYGVRAPAMMASQPPGAWNTFVIRTIGQSYNVMLNGQAVITDFEGNRSGRGHIGLQNHQPKDIVFFRNIIVTPL